MTTSRPLTPQRITRLLARIRKPATASRACERIWRLSLDAGFDRGMALEYLSQALNEHRHVLLAGFLDRPDLVAEHTENRDRDIRYCLKHAEYAARAS